MEYFFAARTSWDWQEILPGIYPNINKAIKAATKDLKERGPEPGEDFTIYKINLITMKITEVKREKNNDFQ